MRIGLRNDGRLLRLMVAVTAVLTLAAPAPSQVIEIGDDGTSRVFSGPTRFVDAGADVPPRAAAAPDESDPFDRAGRAEAVDVKLLRAVAWAESRGTMAAVSPRGALGIMQLMPATAAELGVDPRDRDANISGGARYLARMIARFRTVPLALAAYNAGPAAVLRWGGVPPYAETRAYVASILSRWQAPLVPVARETVMVRPAHGIDSMLIEVP